jgi:hypothetical protein
MTGCYFIGTRLHSRPNFIHLSLDIRPNLLAILDDYVHLAHLPDACGQDLFLVA